MSSAKAMKLIYYEELGGHLLCSETSEFMYESQGIRIPTQGGESMGTKAAS